MLPTVEDLAGMCVQDIDELIHRVRVEFDSIAKDLICRQHRVDFLQPLPLEDRMEVRWRRQELAANQRAVRKAVIGTLQSAKLVAKKAGRLEGTTVTRNMGCFAFTFYER